MLQKLMIALENTSVVHDHHTAVTILVAKGCTVLAEMLANDQAVLRWNGETGQTVLYVEFEEGESWFDVTHEGLRCIYRH